MERKSSHLAIAFLLRDESAVAEAVRPEPIGDQDALRPRTASSRLDFRLFRLTYSAAEHRQTAFHRMPGPPLRIEVQ